MIFKAHAKMKLGSSRTKTRNTIGASLALVGDKKGIWDVRIRRNWVVFLKKEDSVMTLLRTGTQGELGIG